MATDVTRARETDDDLSTAVDGGSFGPNSWIVDEMYRKYLEAPGSVGEAWRSFFADYTPQGPSATSSTIPAPITRQAAPTDHVPHADTPGLDYGEADMLKGAGAVIAERMDASRDLPTATSVRSMPAKLLEVNRKILNNQLSRLAQGGRVSFTHLIGWAVVKAMNERPAMNAAYREIDGKPHIVRFNQTNLGLAMDMERKDGSRTLLVPNIKAVDSMTFREYWGAYEDIVRRARAGKITPDDFAGTTATLTNPGTVGTVQSVPRLMPDQGLIVGVGAIQYPPEYEGADPEIIANAGVGRVLTMTSTYDHRIIQGAESGLFLQYLHRLLLGEERFYDEIFESMEIPYVPAKWAVDANPPAGSRPWAEKQARVFQLINMYRVRGHLIADLDPLRQHPPAIHPELDPLTYGVTIWDLEREFATGGLSGESRMKLGAILGKVRDAYCRTTGIEYMHIQEPDQKRWIQEHVERSTYTLDINDKRRILAKLNEAEAFEQFLHRKFLGAKRFSVEGGESLIPLLDALLNAAADAGMIETAIGMAHRGRLNVLANIVGKPFPTIFQEFEGLEDTGDARFSGDVKYHLGAEGTHLSPSGNSLKVTVAANPSHLEAIDPVLEGIVRAKQDELGPGSDDLILPLLLHGDAAFAGQGVVAETLNLSQLSGYYTGGTVHVVINNQVGFTTSAVDARSSHYATDIAKAVQAPIIHVNGDDPEAVVRVARLAFAFRQAFHKDVVVDLICYRRLGHNEGDEPTYTQPRMYNIIENHRSVRKLYTERLVNTGEITVEEGEGVLASFQRLLDTALQQTRSGAVGKATRHEHIPDVGTVETAVSREQLDAIVDGMQRLPDDFFVHNKLAKTLEERYQLYRDGTADWGVAEGLAYGSLVLGGTRVRLAGEDSQRGTFSHRHAVLVDYATEREFTPLQHLSPDQAPFRAVDSLLSEFAAMGFEYGYSVTNKDALVMWEGQFGDFVNGAQVVIDQFLSSGEDKWMQTCSLVLLLPHGFEGQGPEHSSARVERFLNASAEDNWRVVIPTTTAQHFHMLRRQALHPVRKPLIVFTPKSLLRTRAAFSPVSDFTDGGFQPVIPDAMGLTDVRRVVLCTGKIYYDLVKHRDAHDITDVAVVRAEQLYPYPRESMDAALAPHGDAELVWVQEEPANMGAWRYMSRALFVEGGGRSSRGIYRIESASPATGNPKVHLREQQAIVTEAFA